MSFLRVFRRALSTRSALRAEAKPSRDLSGPAVQLRLVTPTDTLVVKPVYAVTIPAVTGMMGVLADHAPTLAQLKPGVVTVHGADISDITHKYFVSGGFATIKPDSTTIVQVPEAIRFEDLDVAAAKKGLDDANAALQKATSDREKAEAQIAIEVNEAIIQALEQK